MNSTEEGTGYSMKPVDIEWIDALPESWDVVPLSTQAVERSEKNSDGQEKRVLSLSYGNIVERDVESGEGLLPASFDTYQIVNPGNVILRLTDLQNDQRSLRVGQSPYRGIITSAYVCLETRPSWDPRYAYYLLHSYDTTKVFYGMGAGVRQTMGYSDLKQVLVPVPPVPTQQAIASFLDRETAKIDTLIEKKQRLLELLDEKRTALITRAVTRGLDPDVPMKDSGVEWIGEIPEHWEVRRLRHVADIDNSGVWGEDPESEEAEATLVPTTANIGSDGSWDLSGMTERSLSKGERSRYLCRAGDIVVVKSSGSRTNIVSGKAGYVTESLAGLFAFSNFLMRVRPRAGVNSRFIYLLLTSDLTRQRIERMVSTTTYPNLDVPEYSRALLPMPPLAEQNLIVSRVSAREREWEERGSRIRRANSLLQEYRTALISAAVTGKINVRDKVQA